MNLYKELSQGEKILTPSSTSPRLDALLLLSYATGKSREAILAETDREMSTPERNCYRDFLHRRLNFEPIAYIQNGKQFYNLDITVDSRVLIPRPESETLVDTAIESAPANSRLVDIGTGSGCIAIAIKKHREDLEVCASDISRAALEVARANATSHNTSITFRQGDLTYPWRDKFDTIVANLPYVPNAYRSKESLAYEPDQSLFAGEDGLDGYRRFLPLAKNILTPSGIAIIEHLPAQLDSLKLICEKNGYSIESRDDFISILRINPQAPPRE